MKVKIKLNFTCFLKYKYRDNIVITFVNIKNIFVEVVSF